MKQENPRKDSRKSNERGARLSLLGDLFNINNKILNEILSREDSDRDTAYDYHDEMNDCIKTQMMKIKSQLAKIEG